MELDQIFHPLTARPFGAGAAYAEYPPGPALRPYVRCFWASAGAAPALVVPDACMDVIFTIDYTHGRVQSVFCGIDDAPYLAPGSPAGLRCETFAIRFYAWAAVLFAAQDMRNVKNGAFAAEAFFPGLHRALAPRLPECGTQARIRLAEQWLLARLDPRRQDPLVREALALLLQNRGSLRVDALARETHVSARQLERLFRSQVGVSPKRFAALARYQYLWADIACGRDVPVQEAVARYGYADQAHLLHEFRRFHGMTPAQARRCALAARAGSTALAE